MLLSSGNPNLSHPAICSGDQSKLNLAATTFCRLWFMPSLHCLGRLACSQACESASYARYLFQPPLRAISRLTVDGALPIVIAIWRIDALTARPREISSRSARFSAKRERQRVKGAIPPLEATTPCTHPACLPKARPISLKDCPFFHLRHSSAFWPADNPGRPNRAINTSKSTLDQMVLR